MSFTYYEDPILGKGRAQVDTGSGGSGGSSYVGGDRINIAGGTISFVNSADIVNVTGTSVTLQPDTAYKIYATSQAITLNANPPAAGKWAYEGHIELFVAGGYVVTGSNVVLANALEPDSVNNCTVRFHDGIAIISVEDHVAGYIVVSATGTSAGSLYYGLGTASEAYIAVDASLNGQVLDLGGVTTSAGEKHVVGNGYTETVVSGAINCTSKTTFANLGMSNVVVSSGTLTLGDVYIPNGATVAVSGGGLAIEKVVGDGTGVIDLGGGTTGITVTNAIASNVTITGFSYSGNIGSAAIIADNAEITDCTFTGNTGNYGGCIVVFGGKNASVSACTFNGNAGNYPIYTNNGTVSLAGCTLSDTGTYTQALAQGGSALIRLNGCSVTGTPLKMYLGAKIELSGSNSLTGLINAVDSGTVTLASGAILDLTGNTNATPIAPGGGITFASGGATVYPSAGSASAYMLGGINVPQLGNTNVVNLNGSSVECYGGASGISLTSGRLWLNSGAIASNVAPFNAGNMTVRSGGIANDITVSSGGVLGIYSGATATEPIINSGGILIVSSGGSALLVTSNTGATVTVYDGGIITYKE